MGRVRRGLVAVAILIGLTHPGFAADVGWDRLRQGSPGAEAANWLMNAGDLGAQRFSALTVINRDNVAGLRFLLSYPGQIGFGDISSLTRLSAPLVDGGMVYFTDGLGRVTKLDLSSGERAEVVWTADAVFGQMDAFLAGRWNLALAGSTVILTTGDGSVYRIDAETGALLGREQMGDPAAGYVLAAPPLVLADSMVVAGAGGERGAPLELDGLALTDASVFWRTSPQLGDGGMPVTGGSILRGGAYDPDSGLAFYDTSGPLPPLTGETGASVGNANALIAFDPAGGTIRWSQAYREPGSPTHSEEASPVVVPIQIDGEAISKVVHIGDDNLFYRFDGATGTPELAVPIALPVGSSDDADAACSDVLAEPGMPIAYSRTTALVYGAVNNARRCVPAADMAFAGLTTLSGLLVAIDPKDGRTVATRSFDSPLQSGLLATAGGLLVAVTADGTVHVLSDKSLETLWSFDLPSVRASPPITFAVGGRQYIAVLSGAGPFYPLLPYHPSDMTGARHLTVLVVFGLGSDS